MHRFVTLLLTLMLSLAPATAQDLFLTNARIVDPAAREIRHGNLLIADGVIVGSPAQAPEGFSGKTLDVGGQWVMPVSTTEAGKFLGRSFGVGPGDEANLVVLAASPVEDVRNTQRIVWVVQRGVVVDREGLLESARPR